MRRYVVLDEGGYKIPEKPKWSAWFSAEHSHECTEKERDMLAAQMEDRHEEHWWFRDGDTIILRTKEGVIYDCKIRREKMITKEK